MQLGNSNKGYLYGTELNKEDRLDLLECLKTLYQRFVSASPCG
jgi:hypothetical protein